MATNYFTWDNTNQQYTLNTSILDTNNFSLTVKAYDKEKVFLGDINIKTHFQEYVLNTDFDKTTNITIDSTNSLNEEIFWITTALYPEIITPINSKGILLNNNKSYKTTFKFIPKSNKYYRKIRLVSINIIPGATSSYVCKTNYPYFYVYTSLTSTGSNYFKINGQGNNYELFWGGYLYSSRYEASEIRWIYKRSMEDSEQTLTGGTPVFNNAQDLFEIQAIYEAY